ncbi:MAG: EVE domain-containing protein [Promethearchaeota archaeon]|nr:MAG: EVE domain-containing protein [Candidatus Lokiarchaeota archaeon]
MFLTTKDFKYYLFIINQLNWQIVKSGNIIGTNNETIYNQVEKNDKILVYVSGISEIKALYEIISKYKEDVSLFHNKNYPFRFQLNLIKFFEDKTKFKDLVNKLQFIQNKEKWYTHLGGIKGITELSLRDYTALIRSLK